MSQGKSRLSCIVKEYKDGKQLTSNEMKTILENSTDVSLLYRILCEIPFEDGFECYRDDILRFSRGVTFDKHDDLKIASLSVIFRFFPSAKDVRDVVGEALSDGNPIVRDTAAAMVQIYEGCSLPNVDWGDGTGQIVSQLNLCEIWKELSC